MSLGVAVDLVGGHLERVSRYHGGTTYRVCLAPDDEHTGPHAVVLLNLTDDERAQWARALVEEP